MLRIFLALSLLITPATAIAGGTLVTSVTGEWHGVGIQIDGQDWSIEVNLDEFGSRVDYTTTACGGEWQYLRTNDEMLLALELITYGTEFCLDGGLVLFVPLGDDQMLYQWLDSAGKVAAAAVLIRGEFRQDNYEALMKMTFEELGVGFVVGPENARITIEENKI